MAKLRVEYRDGWPLMQPVGKKEQDLIGRNLSAGETVLGQVIGNFGQTVVATDHKVLVVKTGMMAGKTFGGKATSFDYRNIAGVEVSNGFAQGEFTLINPSMQAAQGSTLGAKQEVRESPNAIVYPSVNAKHFEAFGAKIRERASAGAIASPAVASATPAETSIPDQIRQLADLHGAGVLTDEEFANKKAELLSRM